MDKQILTEQTTQLPMPLAVKLAKQTKPVKLANGMMVGATADDEATSGLITYTDDPS